MKWLLAFLVLLTVQARAAEFVIPSGATQLVATASFATRPLGMAPVARNTAYKVGAQVTIYGGAYVCSAAGTTGSGAISGGGEVIVDGTVTWLQASVGRQGLVIQKTAGTGVARVGKTKSSTSFVALSADYSGISFDASYKEAVYVVAYGGSVTITASEW